MMADCERALGRPEKALALSREKQVNDLEPGSQIEMLIVAAGARRDMGQTAAAIQTLEIPELTKRTRADWLPRLRFAYADALQEAGRTDEALVWFHRAAGVDGEGLTGAAERAAELEGLEFTDLDDDDDEDDEEFDAEDSSGEDESGVEDERVSDLDFSDEEESAIAEDLASDDESVNGDDLSGEDEDDSSVEGPRDEEATPGPDGGILAVDGDAAGEVDAVF